jgi:drug/metabolite transporter (DMT)-like permease
MSDSSSAARRTAALAPDVLAALLIVWIVWGSTYLAIKIGVQSVPPFALTAARFLLAGVVLFVIARWRREALPSAAQWRSAAIVGAFTMGGGVGLTSVAEQTNSSSLTTIIVASGSLANLLAAGLILRDWPRRREWAGIVVALAGTVLLAFDGEVRAAPLAALVQMAAIGCWAIGSALSRKLSLAPGAMGNASQMLAGGLAVAVLSVVRGESVPAVVPTSAIGAWLYLALIGSVLAYSAYMHLVRSVSPALATSYSYVNPLVAMALGFLVLDELLSPAAFGAVALIVLGVVMISRARSRERAA